MAKVSYITLPPGSEAFYKKALQSGDRFVFSRIRIKDRFLSRSRVKGITQRSILLELGSVWQGMSGAEQAAWNAAGAISNLNGFKLFVSDTAARRRASIAGYATPNDIYQSMVGRIEIASPATGLEIQQAHPLTYFVMRKVPGTRSQFSPVAVTEPFGFPLTISIRRKTALTALDGNARARFLVIVYSSYQGLTIETPLSISFGMTDSWQYATATLSTVLGPVQGYSAFIEVYNARGNLYFDNVEITHSGENWARDPLCNNIAQGFTRAFFQVARHWTALNPSDGTDFGSVYFVS